MGVVRLRCSMATFFCGRQLALSVGFLCVFFLLAYGQGPSEPTNCTQEAAFMCYDMYRLEFKGARALAGKGIYQKELDDKCRRIKEKLPCHKEIALCPEMSRSNMTLQESGYQAVRDIICDTEALKDSYVAGSCEDEKKLIDCLVEWGFQHHDDDPPRDENVRLCRRLRGSLDCYDETFVASSCPVSLESAKPAFVRTQEALLQLLGCEEPNASARLSSAPQGLLLAMAALAFVRRNVS
ncbi:uncharacterized protein [Dermacentor albipictus]|uniref:uncharacterized protein n=1 Tax=Dermacentor albipictus TaxID=60249 RepID=UPI0038FC7D60